MKTLVLNVLIIFLLFACQGKQAGEGYSYTPESDSVGRAIEVENEEISYDTIILSLKKFVTDSSNTKYFSKCVSWELDKKGVKDILSLSKMIDGHEYHYFYQYLPCEFRGKLKMNGTEYSYQLNAASFMRLSSVDTSFYIGCPETSCESYFLEKGGVFKEGDFELKAN